VAAQTTMNPLVKIAYFGFFSGIIISFFVALIFGFFGLLPENYAIMTTSGNERLLLFLWPSSIFLASSSATGIDALIPVGIVFLINAIRYSFIFFMIGILFKLSPTLSEIWPSYFLGFRKKSIKTLLDFSVRLFVIGSASGFVIVIASYIQASLYDKIPIWVNIVIFSVLPLLEIGVFFGVSDVLLEMFEFIFTSGVTYSLAALFIGILCNMFVFISPKRLTPS